MALRSCDRVINETTMNLSYSDARRIIAKCANTEGDIINATKQALMFIEAYWADDQDWWQYAANPDLVAALGGCTADVFLGWRQ